MRGLAPSPEFGWIRQFQPIPLCFITRGMWDHRVRPFSGRTTRLADRAQTPLADVAGQALIRQAEPQLLPLIEQGAGPQVRVLGQPGADVVDEQIERIRAGSSPNPRLIVTVEIFTDRLAVEPGVGGGRPDTPKP